MAPSLDIDLRSLRYDDEAKVQCSFQAIRQGEANDVSGDGCLSAPSVRDGHGQRSNLSYGYVEGLNSLPAVRPVSFQGPEAGLVSHLVAFLDPIT